jgi:hypothetical protein
MWRLIAKSIQRPSAAYLFPDRIEVDFSSAATRKTIEMNFSARERFGPHPPWH